MTLDMVFVCRLLREPGVSAARELGVVPDMLFDEGRKALEFVEGFFGQYGKMPDAATVSAAAGVPVDEVPPEPLAYYADLVKRRRRTLLLNDAVREAHDSLKNGDADAAEERLKRGAVESGRVFEPKARGFADLRENTKDRWAEYQRVKALGGKIDGKPLPWDLMNAVTMGVHAGEL